MQRFKSLSVGMALFAAGCAAVHPSALNNPLMNSGAGTIVLQPKFNQAQHTQAIVSAYQISDIASLSVVPYIYSGGSYQPISSVTGAPTYDGDPDTVQVSQASPSINLSKAIVLSNLKPNAQYRVIAKAYDIYNGQLSNDASSSVDLAVGTENHPTLGTLPIQMVDHIFAGHTTVSFQKVYGSGSGVQRIDLSLYTLTNGATASVATYANAIGYGYHPSTFAIGNLMPHTTYQVLAEAKDTSGNVISTGSVNIPVTNDDAPATASIALSNIPFLAAPASTSIAPSQLQGVTAFTIDNAGNLYYMTNYDQAIRRQAPDGTLTTLATGHMTYGLTADSAHNIYFVDSGSGTLKKVSPAGVVSTMASGISYAYGIDVDSSGNVYVGDYDGNAVKKVTPAGVVSTLRGIGSPSALTLAPNGYLYFYSNDNDQIYKMDTSGNNFTQLPQPSGGWYNPYSMCADNNSNIYVAEEYSNPAAVVRMDANGNNLTTLATFVGTTAPTAVTIDSSGLIWALTYDGHLVKLY